ncbi:hypothetical protein AAFP30_15185 [Gordonia sp. CPCC 205515]|uniref:hypothetical protein n=1 Tax=Gordonia sp. CPCC 205515 TaxID=3140791 RepID=UPI003AF3E4C5
MRTTTGKLAGVTIAVLALAAIVVTAFLGWRYWDLRSVENARNSSLDSAKRYATTMFGYQPNNVDDHIAKSQSVLTGAAKPTYDDLVSKNNLAAEVRKQGVVSEVTIQDAGVVTNTKNTSQVLIFMNQSVTRGDKELVRVDPSRLTFDMVEQDGVWKISGIDVITDDSFRSKIGVTDKAPANGVPLNPSAPPSSSAAVPVPTPPGASTAAPTP